MALHAEDRYAGLQLFAKVLNLVQQYYVEPVDTQKLLNGGIKGMLKELDPHTNYLPKQIYKEFESETSGEFPGIGVEITLKEGILTVISSVEDTPAWKAGVKAGEKIVEIDGESTKGLSLVEAAQKMRGKRGSKVKLAIFRDGFKEPQNFEITRGVVKLKSVKYTNLEDGYAYVKLTSFIETTFSELTKAIKRHEKKQKDLKGLIIDLRKNPGGLLDQAVKVSDLFLEKGKIVSTIGRDKKQEEIIYANKKETKVGFPIVILIDEYSASASEIVAGAMQDNKRALIMGQRSFGKGSVQSVVKLGDGSGLKLTVARYYTPSGKSIQAQGVQPDVIIDKLDPKVIKEALVTKPVRREKDIKGHLKADRSDKDKKPNNDHLAYWWLQSDVKETDLSPKAKLLRNDFQVLQAYNYLKAWKVIQGFGTAGI